MREYMKLFQIIVFVQSIHNLVDENIKNSSLECLENAHTEM